MADDASLSTLEKDFPHIAERITSFWGKPNEFFAFMAGLVTTDRPGRSGFPMQAAEELLFLESIHERMHGRPVPPWTHV